ncbi:MAG: folylpolyglutamate synthase/dihydrofolate synthase family protein [Bryobacteraceae bacterium]
MTYPDSVRFLYSLGNETKVVKLGLERIQALLHELGNPQDGFLSVHVAGTNGKGSTAAMIAAGLRAGGVRTGLYTSPHLIEPTERIQIDGHAVSEEDFTRAFDTVHRTAIRLIDSGGIDGHPTYFETVTAMAFLLFREAGVERAVVEVGLGGRLDATNVINPEICIIAPVDFDHEQWLGSSLEAIAGEKAGIIKPRVPVVVASQHPEAMAAIRNRAAAAAAAVVALNEWRVENLEMDARGSTYDAVRGNERIAVHCPLAGEHQVLNSLAAAVCLWKLGFGAAGIANAVWPGRLERVAERPEVILDGAHNPAGIAALAGYIRRFHAGRRIWLIYGAVRDKSLGEIAEMLSDVASDVVLAPVDSPRAVRPEALKPLFSHRNVRIGNRLEEAIGMVRASAGAGDAVFITGSLFLVGEARKILTPR